MEPRNSPHLHSHLEGSLPLAFFRQLGGDPFRDIPTLRWSDRFLVYDWFESPERTVEEYVRAFSEYAQTHNTYSEVRLDYFGNLRDLCFAEEVLTEANSLEHIFPLLSLRRQDGPEKMEQDVERAIRLFNKGLIVGIDITGRERGNPPWTYHRVLETLCATKLPYTYHIGEQSGTKELRYLLSHHPTRIGHGLSITADTIEEIRESGTHVEICLTSNLLTGRITSLEQHPVLLIFSQDIPFSLEEDDRTFFDTNQHREYQIFKSLSGCSETDLARITEYAQKAVFRRSE